MKLCARRSVGSCLLLGLVWMGCGQRAYQLPARGLEFSEPDHRLVWTLNAAVLLDRDYNAVDAQTARGLFQASSQRLEQLLPGVVLRAVFDQPQDAPFLMQRTATQPGVHAPERGPLIVPGTAFRARNREILLEAGRPVAGVDQELQRLDRFLEREGLPDLVSRPSAVESSWSVYLEEQSRYDLVLTNAAIWPDDPSAIAGVRSPDGNLRWNTHPAPGRTAMEGRGAYVSLWNESDPGQELTAALFALVFAAPPAWSASALAHDGASVGSDPMGLAARMERDGGCGSCVDYWAVRLDLLGVYARIQGHDHAACEALPAAALAYFAAARRLGFSGTEGFDAVAGSVERYGWLCDLPVPVDSGPKKK
ncbi:MAG: hypothetical protein H7A21_13650 [Spirochaetales bacterium]|nr:hypothetical protein [Spirochaetales bacterium]